MEKDRQLAALAHAGRAKDIALARSTAAFDKQNVRGSNVCVVCVCVCGWGEGHRGACIRWS